MIRSFEPSPTVDVQEMATRVGSLVASLEELAAAPTPWPPPLEADVTRLCQSLVSGQRGQVANVVPGSWSVAPDSEPLPSDARVDFAYVPTYAAVAFLTFVLLERPDIVEAIPGYANVLRRGMEFACGRNLEGHGYEGEDGRLEALRILSMGRVPEFLLRAPEFCPPLTALVQGVEREYRDRLDRGQTRGTWGEEYRGRFEDALESLEDQTLRIKNSSEPEETRIARLYKVLDDFGAKTKAAMGKIAAVKETGSETWYSRSQAQRHAADPTFESRRRVQEWLCCWELLDPASQTFLPDSESLYDFCLSRGPRADFSPFVLNYCRSLENEILRKVFEAYTNDVRVRLAELSQALESALGEPQVKRFATQLKSGAATYTLGEMAHIMQLIRTGGRTLQRSALLQDFRDFTLRYFEEHILQAEYLNEIGEINVEFRVKAAHPYQLDVVAAERCKELVRRALNQFLLSYRRPH